MDFSVTYKTPHWQSKGFCAACPRDGLLVAGDEILECATLDVRRRGELQSYF